MSLSPLAVVSPSMLMTVSTNSGFDGCKKKWKQDAFSLSLFQDGKGGE